MVCKIVQNPPRVFRYASPVAYAVVCALFVVSAALPLVAANTSEDTQAQQQDTIEATATVHSGEATPVAAAAAADTTNGAAPAPAGSLARGGDSMRATLVEQGTFPLGNYNNVARADWDEAQRTGAWQPGIDLAWDHPFGSEYEDFGYLYYQRHQLEDGSWTDFETRSTWDGRQINVLVISPSTATTIGTLESPGTSDNNRMRRRMERWLASSDASPGLINVTSVTAAMFAAGSMPVGNGSTSTLATNDPNTVLRDPETGRFRYDVVVVGSDDLNGHRDGRNVNQFFSQGTEQGARVQAALVDFLDSGRGILFGHDVFFDRSFSFDGTNHGAADWPSAINATRLNQTRNGTIAGTARNMYREGLVGQAAINAAGNRVSTNVGWNWMLSPLAERAKVIPSTLVGRWGHEGAAGGWASITAVRVIDDGYLTTYPNLVDLDQLILVPNTHVNVSLTGGRIWARFALNTNSEGHGPTAGAGFERELSPRWMPGGTTWAGANTAINNNINNNVPGNLITGSHRGNLVWRHTDEEIYQSNAYLSTYRNTATIQTGHAENATGARFTDGTTAAERQLLGNTVIFLAQLTFSNDFTDHSVDDYGAPSAPQLDALSVAGENSTLRISATDQGTRFQGRIEAIPQTSADWSTAGDRNGPMRGYLSNTYEEKVVAGTRGYVYRFHQAEDSPGLELDNLSVDEEGKLILGDNAGLAIGQQHSFEYGRKPDGSKIREHFDLQIDGQQLLAEELSYVSVAAIDYAGNVGEPATFPVLMSLNFEVGHENAGSFTPINNAQVMLGMTEGQRLLPATNTQGQTGEVLLFKQGKYAFSVSALGYYPRTDITQVGGGDPFHRTIRVTLTPIE